MRDETRLRPDLEAPRLARAFLEESFGRSIDESSRATMALLVSELVTNAVLHTETDVTVSGELDEGRVRVAVADREPSTAPAVVPQGQKPSSDTSGRGLLIVDSLADRWGVEVTDESKAVWFELPVAMSPAGESRD